MFQFATETSLVRTGLTMIGIERIELLAENDGCFVGPILVGRNGWKRGLSRRLSKDALDFSLLFKHAVMR